MVCGSNTQYCPMVSALRHHFLEAGGAFAFWGGGFVFVTAAVLIGGLVTFGGVIVFGGVGAGLAAGMAAATVAVALPGCFFWKLSTSVSVPPSFIRPGSGRKIMLFTRMSDFCEARL